MFSSFETLVLSFLSFFLMMIIIRSKWISSYSKMAKNLPPSPFRLPIIGNLHQLGRAPHQTLKTLAHKYGSLMLIHLGSVPVIVASSAEAAQEIMKTHDIVFSNRPKLNIPSQVTFDGKVAVSFSPYGEYWRQAKSLYVHNLLTTKKVQSFRHVREDETHLMLDVIANSCGAEIDLSNMILSLTNDVICQIAYGQKYYEDCSKDVLKKAIDMLGVFSVGDYIPSLSWVDRLSGLERRARKLNKQLNAFLEGVVKQHETGRNESMRNQDMVDMLLEIQRVQASAGITFHRDTIKALMQEIFFAGSDNTFTSIEWAISEVIKHPRVMKKLQQELDEIAQGRQRIREEDLENSQHPYLNAILKESMRFHIPVPLIPREATQDVKVMGYDITAGTRVFINSCMIARDPMIWADADEFKPERFLDSNIDYKGLNLGFLPFGAGRRGCPGIQFAMSVIKLALANLVYKFDFKLPNGLSSELLDMTDSTGGISVHRKYPLIVIPTARF